MNIETEVMAHRYLYYVKAAPVISDFEYDQLEKKAVAELPATSPVHLVGSSRKESYTQEQINRANELSHDSH